MIHRKEEVFGRCQGLGWGLVAVLKPFTSVQLSSDGSMAAAFGPVHGSGKCPSAFYCLRPFVFQLQKFTNMDFCRFFFVYCECPCVQICMCHGSRVEVKGQLQESMLTFCHVESEILTQMTMFDSKHF